MSAELATLFHAAAPGPHCALLRIVGGLARDQQRAIAWSDGGHAARVDQPPENLRGSVIPELLYFEDEAQAERYLGGDWVAFEDLEAIARLDFPIDDCEDDELPLEPGEAIEFLGGRTPGQIREEAAARLDGVTAVDAVWRDDGETEVDLEWLDADEPPSETICAETMDAQPDSGFQAAELVLAMPVMARLKSADHKLDVELDELWLTVGLEAAELRSARFRRFESGEGGEAFDGWITYSFHDDAVEAKGIVEMDSDCVAYPIGGEWDIGQCRYMR